MAYYKEPKYEEKEDDYFPFSSASHVKRYMVNTYGGDNQIENWIRCMVNDELKRRDHDFVRKACESVIRDHVLNELNIIVRSKSEKCTCETEYHRRG